MNWLKKVNVIDSHKQNLGKKTKDIDKKIPGTSKFTAVQESNRLTKINFIARIVEESKNVATTKQVENILDLGNRNREKIKKTSNV